MLAERLRKQAQGQQRIDTSIDAQTQQTVELLLTSRLSALPPRVSMAAMVVDNKTLEVRAYAGSAETSMPLIHRLTETGRVDITVMDEQGHYDRISISVR